MVNGRNHECATKNWGTKKRAGNKPRELNFNSWFTSVPWIKVIECCML